LGPGDAFQKTTGEGKMTETWIGSIPAIEAIILVVGCWFYMWGGRSGKWKRRFLGAFICATAVWTGLLLTGLFRWASLGLYPLLMAGFSLGYGADTLGPKIVKRSIIVATLCASGALMAWILGGNAWWVLPLQGFIGIGSIYLGVKNPLQAAAEEFFVCLLLTECLIMYPMIK
jgi:hypothetical protein